MLCKPIPGSERIAQTEFFDRLRFQSAFNGQELKSRLTGWMLRQIIMEIIDSFIHQVIKTLLFFLLLLITPIVRCQFHTGFFRKQLQCGLEIAAIPLHDITEDITAFGTLSEAAPGSRIRKNHKRRGTGIFVERTETDIVLSRTPEVYVFGNKIYNIDLVFDIFSSRHKDPSVFQFPAQAFDFITDPVQ